MNYPAEQPADLLSAEDLMPFRLPGHEQAIELVFVNGYFPFRFPTIRSSKQLVVLPLETAAANEYKDIVQNILVIAAII